ncbi:MAG: hypothetical protein EBX46_02985, partial [Burkholderiaceae bacterium]|nr:hypothetical protein [Burkholderiaceae bacterium]
MMPMKNLRNYLFLIPYLVAVGVGLKFGYEFGMQIEPTGASPISRGGNHRPESGKMFAGFRAGPSFIFR